MNDEKLLLEEKLYQDFNYEFVCLRHRLGLTQKEMADKSNEEVLITKLIITKDDVKEYESKHHQYKKLRLKENIIVDIVI